jgi:hypothetical protein
MNMVTSRKTSATIAKDASKLLRNQGTPKLVRKVAGSALSQRAPKKQR